MAEPRFGPRTAAIDTMLERARRLSEPEAEALWSAHLREREYESQFRAALEAVTHASVGRDRRNLLGRAENEGRDAVTVFAGTKRGQAIAGYVGRLAEAIAVSDIVDAPSLLPLTRPWIKTIGPLDLD